MIAVRDQEHIEQLEQGGEPGQPQSYQNNVAIEAGHLNQNVENNTAAGHR